MRSNGSAVIRYPKDSALRGGRRPVSAAASHLIVTIVGRWQGIFAAIWPVPALAGREAMGGAPAWILFTAGLRADAAG